MRVHLRRHLKDDRFQAAFDRGAELTLDQVAAYALDERPARPPAPDVTSVLTRREREIAECVAKGMSNKQIADALFIAQRTAECHVENILRKLNFTSRSQIVKTWDSRPPDQE